MTPARIATPLRTASLAQEQRAVSGLASVVLMQTSTVPVDTGDLEALSGGRTEQGVQKAAQNQLPGGRERGVGRQGRRGGRGGTGRGVRGGVLTPFKVEALSETLDFDTMVRLALNSQDRWNTMPNRVRFTCGTPDPSRTNSSNPSPSSPLPACPSFRTCDAEFSSSSRGAPALETLPSPLVPPGTVSACSSGLEDPPGYTWLKPPLNCASWYAMAPEERKRILDALPSGAEAPKWFLPKDREPWLMLQATLRNPDLGCAQLNDFLPQQPAAYSVYRLRGVYACKEAHVFNKRSFFLRSGCQERKHYQMPVSPYPSLLLSRVANLLYLKVIFQQ